MDYNQAIQDSFRTPAQCLALAQARTKHKPKAKPKKSKSKGGQDGL